jgi:hypothetical protein
MVEKVVNLFFKLESVISIFNLKNELTTVSPKSSQHTLAEGFGMLSLMYDGCFL